MNYHYASGIAGEIIRYLAGGGTLSDRLSSGMSELGVLTRDDFNDEMKETFDILKKRYSELEIPSPGEWEEAKVETHRAIEKLSKDLADFCIETIDMNSRLQAEFDAEHNDKDE